MLTATELPKKSIVTVPAKLQTAYSTIAERNFKALVRTADAIVTGASVQPLTVINPNAGKTESHISGLLFINFRKLLNSGITKTSLTLETFEKTV